jgi:hypothetical protein
MHFLGLNLCIPFLRDANRMLPFRHGDSNSIEPIKIIVARNIMLTRSNYSIMNNVRIRHAVSIVV